MDALIVRGTTKTRVGLRAPTLQDGAAFIAAVWRSRALHKPWVTPKAKNPAEYADYVKRFDGEQNHGFLIIIRSSGEIAGVINH